MNFSWKNTFSKTGLFKRIPVLLSVLFVTPFIASGQTLIFSGGGNSYTGSDAVTTDTYSGIDVSACSSIEVSMDYSFSLNWSGSGNMESSDECPFGTNPCTGNPLAQEDGCLNCWDFLYATFSVDGFSIGGDLIGEAGTTDAEQFGTINSGIICNTGSTLEITVNTQTWASNETVSFSNIIVMCWEGAPMASATSPICEGETVDLFSGVVDGSVVNSYSWSSDGGAAISNPGSANTDASGATDGETFTITTTDVNNCPSDDMVTVTVNPAPLVTITGPVSVCNGQTATLSASGTGTTFSWSTGDMTQDITINGPGTYDVTVSDGGTCTAEDSYTVTGGAGPSVSITGADFCEGTSTDLTAEALPTGPAYTYAWSPSGSGPVITVSSAGTYSVTVTDPSSGCTETADISINTIAAPTVTVSGPSTLCPGESSTVSAIANPSNVSYLWGGGETTADITVSGPGTYSVTVSDASGACTASDEITISSSPAPAVVIDVSPSTNACINQPTVISDLGTDAVSWSWSGPNGPISTSQSFIIFPTSPADAGVYSVTITDAGGCTAVDFVNITIAPAISVSASINPDPVCEGAMATLSASSSGAPALSYGWIGPNGILGLGQNIPIGPVTSADEGQYAVGVLSIDGCVDTSFVSLVLAPPVNLSLSASPQPVCEGETLVLSETGNEADTWSWTGPNGFTSTDQSPIVNNVMGPGPLIFDVEGSINGECINTATISIDVSEPPSIDVIASNNPACAGSDVTLFEQGGQAVQWDWTGPNGFVSADQSPVITGVSDLDAGTYSVVITDANGCTNTDFIDLEVDITPVAISIMVEPDPICEGEEITITENGGEGVSWFWNGPNGFNDIGSSITIPGASASNSGLYIVIVTDANGCTAEGDVFVNVNSTPSALAIVANSACSGNNVQLNEVGMDAVQWLWDGPDGFVSVDQNPVISNATTANEGTYTVLVTDANGCTAESSVELALNGSITVQSSASVDTTCEGSSFQLFGNGSDIVDWRWTGPNNFMDSVQNPVLNNASSAYSGYYVLTATSSDGCSGLDSVEVIVSPQPDFSGPVSQSACDALILNAISGTDLVNPSFWTAPGGAAGGGIQIPIGTSITQTSRIYLYDNNAGCESNDSILITITQSPRPGNGKDTVICLGETIDLSSLLTGSDPGGIFVNDLGLPVNSNYSESVSGSYQLYYRLTGTAPCTDDSTGFTVTFESIEDLTLISTADTACIGESIQLSGQGSGVTNFTWTNPQGATSTGSNLSIINAQIDDRGTYRLIASNSSGCTAEASIDLWISEAPDLNPILINPSCDSVTLPSISGNNLSDPAYFTAINPLGSRFETGDVLYQSQRLYVVDDIVGCIAIDSVDIIIEDSPNAGTGRDTIICGGNTVDISSLISGADIGGTYVNLDGAPGFSFPNFNTSSAIPGAYRFSYTVPGNGVCPPAETIIIVTVSQTPTAGIGRDTSLCAGSPIGLFSLLSNADPGGSWINLDGASGFNSATGQWDSSGDPTTNYSFTYTVGGGDCPVDETGITVSLFPALSAGSARDTTICQGVNVNLSDLLSGADPSGTFIDLDGSGGINGTSFNSTGLSAGTYSIAYAVGGNDCPEDRVEFSVSVEDAFNSGLGRDSLICQGNSVNLFDLLEDEDPSGNWVNLDGASNFNAAIGLFNSTGNSPGVYSFEYTIGANSICGSSSTTINITVSLAPSAGTAIPGAICEGEVIDLFDYLDNEDAGGAFSSANAGGGLSGSMFNSQNFTAGSYEFLYEVGGGDCPMDNESITINVFNAPSAGIGRDSILCQGSTVLLLDLITGNDPGGSFTNLDGATGFNVGAGSFNTSNDPSGTYRFEYSVSNGNCPSVSSFINITITTAPSAGQASSTTLCQGETLDLFNLLSGEDIGGTFEDLNNTGGLNGSSFNSTGLMAGIVHHQIHCWWR